MNDMLTPNQVAEILNISPREVRILLRKGKLKGKQPGGWFWEVDPKDVDEFIMRRKVNE